MTRISCDIADVAVMVLLSEWVITTHQSVVITTADYDVIISDKRLVKLFSNIKNIIEVREMDKTEFIHDLTRDKVQMDFVADFYCSKYYVLQNIGSILLNDDLPFDTDMTVREYIYYILDVKWDK